MATVKTHLDFQKELEKKYPNKFLLLNKYKNSKTLMEVMNKKIKVIFNIRADKLLARGPDFIGVNKSIFEYKLKEKYKNNSFEVLEDYKNSKTKIKIRCKKCKTIIIKTPDSFLNSKSKVINCCEGKHIKKVNTKLFQELIDKKFNKQFALIEEYKPGKIPLKFKCKKCGSVFSMLASKLKAKGRDCCNKIKTPQDLMLLINKKYPNKFQLVSKFTKMKDIHIFKHKACNKTFESTPSALLQFGRAKCCTLPSSSNLEQEIVEFIKKNYKGKLITSDRKILNPKELDIYLPDLKLAFEFDGLYWHSEEKIGKDYHLEKTEICENKGIKLIHIFEDEWENKKEICKSRILNLLKKSNKKIYARNCEVLKLNNVIEKNFLNKTHIQGHVSSSIKYGLFYKKNLVAIMTFSKLRNSMSSKNEKVTHELLRFSTAINTSVIGGFSKLLKNILKKEKCIKGIKTFADRRWSNGFVYEKNGFVFLHNSRPNYFYFKNKNRQSRINFQKHKLKDKLNVFDPKKSEKENMKINGYEKIYDSGNKVYYYYK